MLTKRDNRFLSKTETYFVGFFRGAVEKVGPDLREFLADFSIYSILNSIKVKGARVRVFVMASADYLNRSWFEVNQGYVWRLSTYNHESRTAKYSGRGTEVVVSAAANWADFSGTPQQAMSAYLSAEAGFESRFGFGLLGSPSQTGLYAIEQSLPLAASNENLLSDDFIQTLHAGTTQGRTERFLPAEVSDFYYLDRRFAYAADCRLEMPCGAERAFFGEGAKFIPYDPAFYKVDFNPPANWSEVGLLSYLDENGWSWPTRRVVGGYWGVIAEPELRVAIENGWEVKPLVAWRFGKARPLENWRNRLVGLWEAARDSGQVDEAMMFRKILLHGIGGLYARAFTRERVLTPIELGEINDHEALTAEPTGDGRFRVSGRVDRDERHYAPHWAAYTWSRARVALAKRMLAIGKRNLIGCHVDAIYSSADSVADYGTGIGQFRLKGRLRFDEPRQIRTARELALVRAESEAALDGD